MRAVSSILLSSCGVCVNREIKLKTPECVQELKGEHTDLQIRSGSGLPVFEGGKASNACTWGSKRLQQQQKGDPLFKVRQNQAASSISSTTLGKSANQQPQTAPCKGRQDRRSNKAVSWAIQTVPAWGARSSWRPPGRHCGGAGLWDAGNSRAMAAPLNQPHSLKGIESTSYMDIKIPPTSPSSFFVSRAFRLQKY